MNTKEQEFYDRYYYLTSCGIQYNDTDKWTAFFGEIADRIVQDIKPTTVLDAGCAYGYLVAALRDRGVEAYGIDISEYAISQVREDIQQFCTVGSVLDPIDRQYDLIISIEVMEHLQPADSRKAIVNLCGHCNDFLFTSTPADLREATHFNVQPTEYWARIFATQSFFRDVDFDASFVILHAIRFKKSSPVLPDIVGGYEKQYFRYYQENKILREELVNARSTIAQRFNENESPLLEEKNTIIQKKDIHIANLDKMLQDRDQYIANQTALLQEKETMLQQYTERLWQLDAAHLKHMEQKALQQNTGVQQRGPEGVNPVLQKNLDQLSRQLEWLKNEMTGPEANNLRVASSPGDSSKDKIIQSLRIEADNLRLEVNSLKQYNDAHLLPYKADHLELERIRQLKGYKLLWRYYELRDKFLMRSTESKHKPADVVIPNNAQQTISTARHTSYGVLEREFQYYSRNPIYNTSFTYSPLITFVIPVFNTPVPVLKQTILSVIHQTYTNWQLCLLNAGTDNRQVNELIAEFSEKDSRIEFKTIENTGIAGNTNTGITMARGEFVAFLDHDDIIAPHALFEVVSRLQQDEHSVDFFYSDKDMLLEDGSAVYNPLYKPKWSTEIMFSANYLTHFCVVRKSILEKAGLLDSQTDGAQDWDIYLKVSRLTDKIDHIPAKLYHWRTMATSVASGIGAKPYALAAQLLSIQNHLNATALNATVKFSDQAKSILQLSWNNAQNHSVTFIVHHNGTRTQLQSLIGQIEQYSRQYNNTVHIAVLGSRNQLAQLSASASYTAYEVEPGSKYAHINTILQNDNGEIIVFADSQVAFDNAASIHELTSWAAQEPYGAISPQFKDQQQVILSTGLAINGDYILDVFRNVGVGHYTIFGHSAWYRNITAVRTECFAVRSTLLKNAGFFTTEDETYTVIATCLALQQQGYRHVYNPFAKVSVSHLPDLNQQGNLQQLAKLRQQYQLTGCDAFWNPNLLPNNGVPTENKRKTEVIPSANNLKPVITGWEKYSSDAFYLAHEFDFSTDDVRKNFEVINAAKGPLNIKSVNWILPHFDFLYYAGLYTIFRFAAYLQSVEGVQNTFVTVGGNNEKELHNIIVEAFPLLRDANVVCMAKPEDITKIPYADASICTLWTTAYYLLRFQNTRRKFYFIQDFEPLFYPAGSTYGQTETTYKFGFYGITNTQGLRKIYEEMYNGVAIDLKPCIDNTVFYRSAAPAVRTVKNVFFYGRPGHPRNGFELGTAALKILKNRMQDSVQIFCAGSDWDPADYGLTGIINNMGRMDFEQTADLYRVCDAGLVMMFTKHPSYLPFELMACGCAVVSNYNKDTTWFLKDGINCLLTEASATRIAETIETLLSDDGLRNKITDAAAKDIGENHATWNTELGKLYQFMQQPDSSHQQ